MIRYLIKNNFKIISRNPINILVLTLAPIIVSAVLISAFSAMMEKYEEVGDFKVGYSCDQEETTALVIDGLKAIAAEQGISFTEYTGIKAEEAVEDNKLAGFVEIGKDSYTVYKTDEHMAEGQILEYMLHAFYENMSPVISEHMLPAGSGDMQGYNVRDEAIASKMKVETADFIPAVDSTDYYGIIYMIYFSWCCIVCGAGLFTAEKKYGIEKRQMVSGISDLKEYLSKFLPMVLMACEGLAIYGILSIVLLDVHWGNMALSAILVVLGIMAATALGLMVYAICDNMVVTVIIVFMLVWAWGFLGGSFETYIFSGTSEFLKKLSPIYYENRAVVELSCMGESEYVIKSIICSGVMVFVCSAIAVLAGALRRKGGKK